MMDSKTLRVGDQFLHVHSGKVVRVAVVYFAKVDVQWPDRVETFTKKMIYGAIKRKSLVRI